MDWMKKLFPADNKQKMFGPATISYDRDGNIRADVFKGNWREAEKVLGDLPDGLQKVLNFAFNSQGPHGKGVREVGAKMVFELKNIEVDQVDENGNTVAEDKVLGDYEIEVRRVR